MTSLMRFVARYLIPPKRLKVVMAMYGKSMEKYSLLVGEVEVESLHLVLKRQTQIMSF